MKNLLRIIPLLSILLIACQEEAIEPSGSINQTTHTLSSSYFQVSVSDGIEFTISPSDSDKVVIETDKNMQKAVSVKLMGNILYISKNAGYDVHWSKTTIKADIQTTKSPKIIQGSNGSKGYCTFPLLGQNGSLTILLSEGSTFQSAVNMPTGNIWLEQSDSSKTTLSGKAKEFRIESESGSTTSAYNLTATNLILQIFSGGSKAYATVTEKIFAVKAEGASILYYRGAAIIQPNSTFIEGASAVYVD